MTIDQATQQATAFHQAGRFPEAEDLYRRVLAVDPDHPAALYGLGMLAKQFNQLTVAVELLNRSLARRPDPQVYIDLGDALKLLGQKEQSLAAFSEAARLLPNHPVPHANLGMILWEMKRLPESLAAYRKALALDPDHSPSLHGIMNVLGDMGDPAGALAAGRRAAELGKWNTPAFWSDLGIAYSDMGDIASSIRCHQRAIEIDPQAMTSQYNLSQMLLLTGEFARGWELYEWRWKMPKFPSPKRNFAQPQWEGQEAPDKLVLLHAEQGAGDAIMFARYIPLAARRARIAVECPPALCEVLRTVGGAERFIRAGDDLGAFDYHLPLLSVGRVMKTTLATIPADVPYLRADPQSAATWAVRMQQDRKLRVALAWAGAPHHTNDRNRSMLLKLFAPLAAIEDVSFYSLQKGQAASQIQGDGGALKLIDWTEELKDYADTAAFLQNLDLLISVDTSIVHLAGAMAKPVWTLLPFAPDWRWLLSRPDDTPWYPTMRLFRQDKPGAWEQVIQRVVSALIQFPHPGRRG